MSSSSSIQTISRSQQSVLPPPPPLPYSLKGRIHRLTDNQAISHLTPKQTDSFRSLISQSLQIGQVSIPFATLATELKDRLSKIPGVTVDDVTLTGGGAIYALTQPASKTPPQLNDWDFKIFVRLGKNNSFASLEAAVSEIFTSKIPKGDRSHYLSQYRRSLVTLNKGADKWALSSFRPVSSPGIDFLFIDELPRGFDFPAQSIAISLLHHSSSGAPLALSSSGNYASALDDLNKKILCLIDPQELRHGFKNLIKHLTNGFVSKERDAEIILIKQFLSESGIGLVKLFDIVQKYLKNHYETDPSGQACYLINFLFLTLTHTPSDQWELVYKALLPLLVPIHSKDSLIEALIPLLAHSSQVARLTLRHLHLMVFASHRKIATFSYPFKTEELSHGGYPAIQLKLTQANKPTAHLIFPLTIEASSTPLTPLWTEKVLPLELLTLFVNFIQPTHLCPLKNRPAQELLDLLSGFFCIENTIIQSKDSISPEMLRPFLLTALEHFHALGETSAKERLIQIYKDLFLSSLKSPYDFNQEWISENELIQKEVSQAYNHHLIALIQLAATPLELKEVYDTWLSNFPSNELVFSAFIQGLQKLAPSLVLKALLDQARFHSSQKPFYLKELFKGYITQALVNCKQEPLILQEEWELAEAAHLISSEAMITWLNELLLQTTLAPQFKALELFFKLEGNKQWATTSSQRVPVIKTIFGFWGSEKHFSALEGKMQTALRELASKQLISPLNLLNSAKKLSKKQIEELTTLLPMASLAIGILVYCTPGGLLKAQEFAKKLDVTVPGILLKSFKDTSKLILKQTISYSTLKESLSNASLLKALWPDTRDEFFTLLDQVSVAQEEHLLSSMHALYNNLLPPKSITRLTDKESASLSTFIGQLSSFSSLAPFALQQLTEAIQNRLLDNSSLETLSSCLITQFTKSLDTLHLKATLDLTSLLNHSMYLKEIEQLINSSQLKLLQAAWLSLQSWKPPQTALLVKLFNRACTVKKSEALVQGLLGSLGELPLSTEELIYVNQSLMRFLEDKESPEVSSLALHSTSLKVFKTSIPIPTKIEMACQLVHLVKTAGIEVSRMSELADIICDLSKLTSNFSLQWQLDVSLIYLYTVMQRKEDLQKAHTLLLCNLNSGLYSPKEMASLYSRLIYAYISLNPKEGGTPTCYKIWEEAEQQTLFNYDPQEKSKLLQALFKFLEKSKNSSLECMMELFSSMQDSALKIEPRQLALYAFNLTQKFMALKDPYKVASFLYTIMDFLNPFLSKDRELYLKAYTVITENIPEDPIVLVHTTILILKQLKTLKDYPEELLTYVCNIVERASLPEAPMLLPVSTLDSSIQRMLNLSTATDMAEVELRCLGLLSLSKFILNLEDEKVLIASEAPLIKQKLYKTLIEKLLEAEIPSLRPFILKHLKHGLETGIFVTPMTAIDLTLKVMHQFYTLQIGETRLRELIDLFFIAQDASLHSSPTDHLLLGSLILKAFFDRSWIPHTQHTQEDLIQNRIQLFSDFTTRLISTNVSGLSINITKLLIHSFNQILDRQEEALYPLLKQIYKQADERGFWKLDITSSNEIKRKLNHL